LVREDKLIWSEEKDGVYSVRTGYRKIVKSWKQIIEDIGRLRMVAGVLFGKFMPHLKLNTCFGEFVGGVYRLVPG
jgi:hypothetical protein